MNRCATGTLRWLPPRATLRVELLQDATVGYTHGVSGHPFDNGFVITGRHKEQFQTDGFVKLKGFFNADVVDTLLDRVEVEMNRKTRGEIKADPKFTRVKYDFESDRNEIFALLERPYFRRALTDLVEHDLFLTFELCFELGKNVSRGFPWHVGVQSFGFQPADEFGCTLWAPLHPIDTKGQRGGMAYVPEHVISGDYIFRYIEPAIVSTIEAKERTGVKTSADEYSLMRAAFLNASPMVDVLDHHRVEDDFEPGDVLIFNKYVVHRSIMLGEGVLPRRAAYVMRLVDAGSHYDLQRARNLDFPVVRYGEEFTRYTPYSRQPIEIAEAGAEDGAALAECAYFSDRERRIIRREPSREPG